MGRNNLTEIPDEDDDIPWWENQTRFWGICRSFFKESTMAGIDRTCKPQPVWLRLLWFIACSALWGILLWQIVKLVKDYLERPTNMSSSLAFEKEVPFPSFTVCPLNPIKISRMYNSRFITPKLQRLMTEQIAAWSEDNSSLPYLAPHAWTPDDLNAGQFLDLEAIHDGMLSEDWDELANKIYERPPSVEEADFFCNTVDDFIVQCSITANGRYEYECSSANFTTRMNDEYCHCFEFTPEEQLYAMSPGNSYYVSDLVWVYLYSDTLDENPMYTSGAEAVQYMVHPPGIHAFPQVTGQYAHLGTVTYIGITEKQIERQESPWGECDKDQWRTTVPCLQHLVSVEVINQCGCYNPYILSPVEFPLYTEGVPRDGEGDNGTLPECTSAEDWACVYDVYLLDEVPVQKGDIPCDQQICKETVYDQEASVGTWPTPEYLQSIVNDDIQTYMSENGIQSREDVPQEVVDAVVQGNEVFHKTATLYMYFKELNRQVTKEVKAVTPVLLLSNIGGLLGLFVGFSVVTALDMTEFLVYMVFWVCHPLGQLLPSNTVAPRSAQDSSVGKVQMTASHR
eukprot:jgi/Mesvir1/3130/Mv16303-RA.1